MKTLETIFEWESTLTTKKAVLRAGKRGDHFIIQLMESGNDWIEMRFTEWPELENFLVGLARAFGAHYTLHHPDGMTSG